MRAHLRTRTDTMHRLCEKVRNHVLTRWRADVTRYLPLEEAGRRIQAKFQPLVKLAWESLGK